MCLFFTVVTDTFWVIRNWIKSLNIGKISPSKNHCPNDRHHSKTHFYLLGVAQNICRTNMSNYWSNTWIYKILHYYCYKQNTSVLMSYISFSQAQFVILAVQQVVGLLSENCEYPKMLLIFYLTQALYMLYLFGQFYYKSYLKPSQKKED